MRNILITGSEGNIGAFVSKHASRHPNWHTIGVTRHSHAEPHTDQAIIGDLTDATFVSRLFAMYDIDTVIHAAAPAYRADVIMQDPYGTYANDVLCFLNVLRYATSIKHLIYLSSATVYEGATDGPFTEDLTERIPPPSSSVGVAKLASERALRFWSAQHKIPHTNWRLFNVISPRESHATPGGHVTVDFYRRLFVEHVPTLEIFGNGNQVRCFTWVEDVADAIVRFADDTRTINQTFNLGGNEPVTLFQLKDLMLEIGAKHKLLPAGYAPKTKTGGTFFGTDSAMRIPSLEKTSTQLGWKAPTSFRDCLEKFIDQAPRYAHH